ncbi:hypothetical protein QJT93_21225 [Bordetella bronchiseptica]
MVRARPKETTMSATLRCHVPPKPDPIPPDSPPGDLPVDPDTDDRDIDLPPPDAPGDPARRLAASVRFLLS